MACGATLKRSLEFDPVHSPGRSPKRMCMPIDFMSPNSQSRAHCSNTLHGTAFVEAAQKFVNGQSSSAAMSVSSGSLSPSRSQSLVRNLSQQSSPTSTIVSATNILETANGYTLSPPSVHLAKDQPVFTLSQVDSICCRIVGDHEKRVREKFDKVLNDKLAEQYEAFLKFNHLQLKQKFDNQFGDCSYVS